MAKCKNCGSHVSDYFERVFADDEGNVYAYPECAANAGIAEVSTFLRWSPASPNFTSVY